MRFGRSQRAMRSVSFRTSLTVLILLSASHAFGQTPTTTPRAFEVATIKRSASGLTGDSISFQGTRLVASNTALSDIIQIAYNITPRQMVDAPGWLDSERYDIVAQPEGDQPLKPGELSAMLQTFLADRLQLKFHR